MKRLCLSVFFLCIFPNISTGLGVDYIATSQNEGIVSKCEEYPDNYIDIALDSSKMNLKYEDDEIFMQGEVKFLLDLPKDRPLEFSSQIFKKQRGEWVPTIYTIHRTDVCHSLFDPHEFWHHVTKNIPADKQNCPPEKGEVYEFNQKRVAKIENVQARDLEGHYKLVSILTFGPEANDFVCFKILCSLDRI